MEQKLTNEQINSNRELFISLLRSIDVEGAAIENLITWLSKSDFFIAPASTKFHAAYDGGLCQHSLNVYNNLVKLVNDFAYDVSYNYVKRVNENGEEVTDTIEVHTPKYTENDIKIVALLHDISKANYYEKYNRNVKNEVTNKWEQVTEYRTRDISQRFIYGNHETNSEFMVHAFIPLTVEQSVAILNHHGGVAFDSSQVDVSPIYNKYNLAVLLHLADMLACYVDEKIVY